MAAVSRLWENPPGHFCAGVILTETSDALMREAAQLHRQDRVVEAMAAYQAIVARWPKHADAWFNLAVLQRHSLHLHDALAAYQKALNAGVARPEEAHLNRSVIYSDFLRDHAAAARELDQALTLNPKFTPALLNLANLYEDHGKRVEASSLYARILAIDPASFEALARFANVQPTGVIDPALITRLQSALAGTMAPADRASVGFALGRLLDASARYAEAFAAYRDANQASGLAAGAHVTPYDRTRQQAFVDKMIASGIPPNSAHPVASSPRPIFIVGMFRSGSTLTEQLLAATPGVAAGGELAFLPQMIHNELTPFFETIHSLTTARLDGLAAGYRAELLRVSASSAYVTDKRPDNFLYVGLIKKLFPDAKIVHTTRNPLDTCLSIYFLHLEQQMSYALDLLDTGHYFREYRRLMAHWKAQFPHDIHDFDYDVLVRDPKTQLQRLCEFLELEWPGQVPQVSLRSGAIRTASVWQVREPLYTSSSGRSQHYAKELAELAEYLSAPI